MTRERGQNDEDDFIQLMGEVQAAEKASNSLTRLPDDLYERASGHLRSLLVELENCTPEQGRAPDEMYYRLSERLKRGKQILERIYSTRERKIVLLALNQSRRAGPRTDERARNENMLRDEEELYYNLKVELETMRDRLLKFDKALKKPVALRPETGIDTTTDDFLDDQAKGPDTAVNRPPILKRTPAMEAFINGKRDEGPSEGPSEKKGHLEQGQRMAISGEKRLREAEGFIVVRALVDFEPLAMPDGSAFGMRREEVASISRDVARVLIEGGLAKEVGEGT